MSIEWERDEYEMLGTERELGEYEFRAAIIPGRDEICGEVSGYAEITASCWLVREEQTLSIARLLVFPHLGGIMPTPSCEQCSGIGQYVGLPGDKVNDCPWCGGTGLDVVAQAQRFVEVLWGAARLQVALRVGCGGGE